MMCVDDVELKNNCIAYICRRIGKKRSGRNDISLQEETTMKEMMNWIANEEEGQGMVEYALILALVAIAAIAILPSLGTKVKSVFSQVDASLPG